MNWFDALPSSAWWELVPAAIGAIIGALAGGLAAYVLALRSSKEVRIERLEAKRQNDAAKLFRLFSTLSSVINSLANTIILIRQMYENSSNPVGDKYPKQRVIREIANMDHEEYLALFPDDVAVLFASEQSEFATALQTIVNQFNAVQNSLKTFNRAKREVVDHLMLADDHSIGADGAVISKFDNKHRAKLVLLEARCESIIAPTLINLIHVTNLALEAAEGYRLAAKACLPDASKLPGFPLEEVERIRSDLPELQHGL